MFLRLAAFIGLVAGSCSPAFAQKDYLDQVRGYVNGSSATRGMLDREFRAFSMNTAYLVSNSNTYQDITYELRIGYVYAFVAACDEDCRDIDLVLYGPNGEKIVEDKRTDDNPSIWFFATTAGRYTIRATIPRCNAPVGCYLAVKALYK